MEQVEPDLMDTHTEKLGKCMCSQIFIPSIDPRVAAVRGSAFAFLAIQFCEVTDRLSGHVSTQQTAMELIDASSSGL